MAIETDINDAYIKPGSTSDTDNQNMNGLLGVAALMGGAYTASRAMPASFGRRYADHMSNFLQGFYEPGANKALLYGQEAQKGAGRLLRTALSPTEAIAYRATGVSSFLKESIDTMKDDLRQVDRDFVEGKYGGLSGDQKNRKGLESAMDRAKQAKRQIIKERHYKALNDSANRHIFGGKRSKVLEDYRKKEGRKGTKAWFYKSNAKEFLESGAGNNKEKMNYILSRHKVGTHEGVRGLVSKQGLNLVNPKTLKYLKWTDNSISGVLRGAQFNFKTYQILDTLKKGRFGQGAAISAIQSAGYNPTLLSNGRILFSFSPAMKSNFDWGGYNVVAEWDYKNPGKVRFIGTDLRDTPASSMFKGKHVLNYVESKKMNIISMKDNVDINTAPKYITKKEFKAKAQAKTNPKNLLNRQQIVDNDLLRLGKQHDNIIHDLEKVSERKDRSSRGQHNLIKRTGSKIMKGDLTGAYKGLSRSALRYGSLAARAGGGIGMMGLAAGSLLYNALKED